MLDFAGVNNPEIQVMCPEYLIADKLTLYLKQQSDDFSADRLNDIAHSALIIEKCHLDQDRLAEGPAQSAIQRNVVNDLIERNPGSPLSLISCYDPGHPAAPFLLVVKPCSCPTRWTTLYFAVPHLKMLKVLRKILVWMEPD